VIVSATRDGGLSRHRLNIVTSMWGPAADLGP